MRSGISAKPNKCMLPHTMHAVHEDNLVVLPKAELLTYTLTYRCSGTREGHFDKHLTSTLTNRCMRHMRRA